MDKLKMGILGAGGIAAVMAETINKMDEVICLSVAARDEKRAEEFAKKHGFQKFFGSYEEMLQDEELDLVYIATPHSHHLEHGRLCIDYHKAVLCEKAFTANGAQARELISYAKEKKVLITEAIWTRYMPFLQTMKEVVDSGIIGKPTMLTANLGYDIDGNARLVEPELAGGALLDVGVYTINFARMMFGTDIDKISSVCTYTKTGVDEQNSITLTYKDGKMAVLHSSMLSISDRKGIIHGDKGFVIIENINNFESLKVYDTEYKEVASYSREKQISGYEYEVLACKEALEKGALECPQMPHEETLKVMDLMDSLRSQWGIRYPFE